MTVREMLISRAKESDQYTLYLPENDIEMSYRELYCHAGTVAESYLAEGVKKGDIILMCTDGLTNMVDDDEILRITRTGVDVPEIAENLIKMANHNGGKDNIGVVIIENV